MAETIKEIFPNALCSDCGGGEIIKQHRGPLVPEGEFGIFCQSCWQARYDEMQDGFPPRPLGTAPRKEKFYEQEVTS